MGSHVCKRGDRFAALQPVTQGLAAHFGGVTANASHRLSLRMDNGTPYISEHFGNQAHLRVEASYALIERPHTNGVAVRFEPPRVQWRPTRSRSCTAACIARWLSRAAVGKFVDVYNEQWLPEKYGFMSPPATRAAWYAQHGMKVAA